jgi:hypothetical protein
MSPKYKLDRAKNSRWSMACLNRMNYKFYDMWFDLDCGYAGNSAICSERMAFENSCFLGSLLQSYYFLCIIALRCFYISVVPLI